MSPGEGGAKCGALARSRLRWGVQASGGGGKVGGAGQTEKDDPQPQVLFTPGLLNLNPEPWSPST